MTNDNPQRSSQFHMQDILLLIGGCSFALALLITVGGRQASDKAMAVAVVALMTLVGTAISYPIWRFCMGKRLTVCVTNHAGYLLLALIVLTAENPRLLREIPVFLAGPLSLIGYLGSWHPSVSGLWGQVLIVAFLTGCFVLLMSAHPFRPNLIGVTLTSLGTAMWYLAGVYGVLARGP